MKTYASGVVTILQHIARGKSMREAMLYEGLGFGVVGVGNVWYVNTVTGSDKASGKTPTTAFKTMAYAFTKVGDNDIIGVLGDVREQIIAPLGITGVSVIGMAGGRTRHDDGVRWREPATALDAPLLTLRNQGWEVHNILFVPQDGYSSIRLRREETTTYPDGSHAVIEGCKFIGGVAHGSHAGLGIEDYGGMHHVLICGNEFSELDGAIIATNVSIAAPLRNLIEDNIFEDNVVCIAMNGSLCTVRRNQLMTPYSATYTTHINMAYTADPATGNFVVDNILADATANVTIAKGYKPSTGDVWRNWVTDAADAVVAVPA